MNIEQATPLTFEAFAELIKPLENKTKQLDEFTKRSYYRKLKNVISEEGLYRGMQEAVTMEYKYGRFPSANEIAQLCGAFLGENWKSHSNFTSVAIAALPCTEIKVEGMTIEEREEAYRKLHTLKRARGLLSSMRFLSPQERKDLWESRVNLETITAQELDVFINEMEGLIANHNQNLENEKSKARKILATQPKVNSRRDLLGDCRKYLQLYKQNGDDRYLDFAIALAQENDFQVVRLNGKVTDIKEIDF